MVGGECGGDFIEIIGQSTASSEAIISSVFIDFGMVLDDFG